MLSYTRMAFIQPRHAVRRFRRQNMGLRARRPYHLLLHRQQRRRAGLSPSVCTIAWIQFCWFSAAGLLGRLSPSRAGLTCRPRASLAVQLRRVDPGEMKTPCRRPWRVAPSRVIKCVKCERSAASAPPAPSADSSPISSRFFHRFPSFSPRNQTSAPYAEVNGIGRATAGTISAGGDGIGVPVVVTAQCIGDTLSHFA